MKLTFLGATQTVTGSKSYLIPAITVFLSTAASSRG